MKQKLLGSFKIQIFGLLAGWIVLHSILYFKISSIDPNISFLSSFLLLQTFGVTMILASLLSFTMNVFPLNFYKTDGKKFLFSHNRLNIFIKIILVFFSVLFYTIGILIEPQSDLIDNYYANDWSVWIVYIFGGLFCFALIIGIISSIKNLIKNRNDFIYIDTELIKWFDNVTGKMQINHEDILKIEIERVKSSRDDTLLGIDSFKILTQNETKIINLEKMSFKPFGDKILEIIELTFPKKEIIDPKFNNQIKGELKENTTKDSS